MAYLTTFIVMLALVPVFGWAVARSDRRQLLGAVHGFFALIALNLALLVPAFLAQQCLGAFALGVVFLSGAACPV
ncbi:MAG: hypothetical protein ACYCPE_07390 [Metallibacterium sp.]